MYIKRLPRSTACENGVFRNNTRNTILLIVLNMVTSCLLSKHSLLSCHIVVRERYNFVAEGGGYLFKRFLFRFREPEVGAYEWMG